MIGVELGVPKESVLGTILYNLYADDVQAFVRGPLSEHLPLAGLVDSLAPLTSLSGCLQISSVLTPLKLS